MSAPEKASAPAATTTTGEQPSTLDLLVKYTKPQSPTEESNNKKYIEQFIRQAVKPGQVISKDVENTVKLWIAEIDKKVSAQLNEVMHHADFQRLESAWRGLHYLVHQSETGEGLKIRVMNVTKRELFKDVENATEFDQSQLFKKVYEAEYGQLGGEPYGLLVGDYEFTRHPEDVQLLKKISNVAAAAHAPFVAAASSKLMNLDSWTDLSRPRDLAMIFQSVEYASWKSFRESEDSRYVALTMPRVLSRLPYGKAFKTIDEFDYEEDVDGKEHDKYLWMNAAWAYAARVTDAFAKDGWFARTRGVQGGGKVEGLPVHTFPTDDGDVAMKTPTEIAISDRREFELSNLGFLPLLHAKNRDFAAFLGSQACQKPKKYEGKDADAANSNAELSAKFNFIMCVSRFAHYLKVMARDKIGKFMEVKDCERWLNDWINNYVLADPSIAGEETRAKSPLADARVDVRPVKGKPGWYEAVAYLRPHFQFEALQASMRLVAEVPKPKS
jgi:type VI secretion system protein ImpC